MASIVVYDSMDSRVAGMTEAGRRMNEKIDADLSPDDIVVETLKELLTAGFRITYTDGGGHERDLTWDAGPRFTYTDGGGSTQTVIIRAHHDRPSAGADVMNIAVPRDPIDLVSGGYLATILTDVGSPHTTDPMKQYLLGTLMLRRCK